MDYRSAFRSRFRRACHWAVACGAIAALTADLLSGIAHADSTPYAAGSLACRPDDGSVVRCRVIRPEDNTGAGEELCCNRTPCEGVLACLRALGAKVQPAGCMLDPVANQPLCSYLIQSGTPRR
jgi:hypothetical protein